MFVGFLCSFHQFFIRPVSGIYKTDIIVFTITAAKHRFITSHNGPKGGYVLTRRPETITVGQVVRALEGPLKIVSCYEDDSCPQMERCNIRRPVQKIQTAISYMLDTMSLAELTTEDVPDVFAIKA